MMKIALPLMLAWWFQKREGQLRLADFATAAVLLALPVGLIVTALPGMGITRKGATRWINIGMVFQPSEILKIAMPLMLAWWFQKREGQRRVSDFVVAGLSWKLIVPVLVVGAVAITAIVVSEDRICQPDVKWPMLRDYQKNRVCTLLDPTTDPLGKGFHIIQGMIAIGSGGVDGKGFMKGTQTHLEFIPERTTDFIFAAFSEEFGLVGCASLVLGFTFLIFRGLMIAAEAPTAFTRLLAGAITMSWFTYAFVNMGMVSGILPVVGVPLPFISYGGTAMVTLGLGLGILMSISKSRRLIQS